MNIKCPTCGGNVVYDVESGMMKCISCNRTVSNEEFAHLNEPEKRDAALKIAFAPKSKDDSNESSDNNEEGGSAFELKSEQKSGFSLRGMELPKADDNPENKQSAADTPRSDGFTFGFSDNQANTDTPKSQKKKNKNISFNPDTGEFMELNIYHCNSCGADLMVGQSQASTFCSYCGAPSIVFDRVAREETPNRIIPFKLTQEQALSCIRDRFGHGRYIPPKIRNLTPEDVHAIYIPYWLYTASIRKKMTVKVKGNDSTGIHVRDASATYHDITMDASMKLNNDLSNRLEPYYMNEAEDFDISYLSGFFADKYDVPYDAMLGKVQKKCSSFLKRDILSTCPGTNSIPTKNGQIANYTISDEEEDYNLEDVAYAFLPAYFINLRYDNSQQLIMVNGQTGKVVGNVPFEKEHFALKLGINGLISCIIFCLISVLFTTHPKMMPTFLVLIVLSMVSLVVGILSYRKYKDGMKKLASKQMSLYSSRREEI